MAGPVNSYNMSPTYETESQIKQKLLILLQTGFRPYPEEELYYRCSEEHRLCLTCDSSGLLIDNSHVKYHCGHRVLSFYALPPGVSPYQCVFCSKLFKITELFIAHVRNHRASNNMVSPVAACHWLNAQNTPRGMCNTMMCPPQVMPYQPSLNNSYWQQMNNSKLRTQFVGGVNYQQYLREKWFGNQRNNLQQGLQQKKMYTSDPSHIQQDQNFINNINGITKTVPQQQKNKMKMSEIEIVHDNMPSNSEAVRTQQYSPISTEDNGAICTPSNLCGNLPVSSGGSNSCNQERSSNDINFANVLNIVPQPSDSERGESEHFEPQTPEIQPQELRPLRQSPDELQVHDLQPQQLKEEVCSNSSHEKISFSENSTMEPGKKRHRMMCRDQEQVVIDLTQDEIESRQRMVCRDQEQVVIDLTQDEIESSQRMVCRDQEQIVLDLTQDDIEYTQRITKWLLDQACDSPSFNNLHQNTGMAKHLLEDNTTDLPEKRHFSGIKKCTSKTFVGDGSEVMDLARVSPQMRTCSELEVSSVHQSPEMFTHQEGVPVDLSMNKRECSGDLVQEKGECFADIVEKRVHSDDLDVKKGEHPLDLPMKTGNCSADPVGKKAEHSVDISMDQLESADPVKEVKEIANSNSRSTTPKSGLRDQAHDSTQLMTKQQMQNLSTMSQQDTSALGSANLIQNQVLNCLISEQLSQSSEISNNKVKCNIVGDMVQVEKCSRNSVQKTSCGGSAFDDTTSPTVGDSTNTSPRRITLMPDEEDVVNVYLWHISNIPVMPESELTEATTPFVKSNEHTNTEDSSPLSMQSSPLSVQSCASTVGYGECQEV